jgi:hypothetical protein
MTSLEMKYFVLEPRAKHRHDIFAEASQCAMHAFADALEEHGPVTDLTRELRLWASKEHARQLHLPVKGEKDGDPSYVSSL